MFHDIAWLQMLHTHKLNDSFFWEVFDQPQISLKAPTRHGYIRQGFNNFYGEGIKKLVNRYYYCFGKSIEIIVDRI